MSDLEKRLMQKKIIGGLSARQEEVGNLSQILEETPIASPNLPPTSVSNRNKRRAVDCTQLPWTDFFDQKQNVQVGDDTFNVYIKGDSGPVFYLLHGAGYSGLTWSCFAEELSSRIECRIVAPDLRAHGDTITTDNDDLSSDRQVSDIVGVYNAYFVEQPQPPTFLIGHSMGGALAVRAANLLPSLIALAVIDVVEGSAVDALSCMLTVLRHRPVQFESIDAAIQWCLQTGTARNNRAARVSMPSQIRSIDATTGYTWRVHLEASQPHWLGWFNGLSQLFLSVRAPKLLILANVDRLDKDLTVGQMQGKFQMIVLPKVGHAVQEDSPDRLADAIAAFAVRHGFCAAKGDFAPVYPAC